MAQIESHLKNINLQKDIRLYRPDAFRACSAAYL